MNRGVWPAVATVVFMLTSCNQNSTAENMSSPERPKNAAPFLSVPEGLRGLEDCPSDVSTQVKQVVRIRIPKNLSEIATSRRLVRYSPVATTGDDDDIFNSSNRSKENAARPGDKKYAENPFHITTGTIDGKSDEYLQVRVILRNNNFKFLTSPASPDIHGVAYETKKPVAWLCQIPPSAGNSGPIDSIKAAGKPDRSRVIFYIKRGAGEEASINFLIGADRNNDATAGEDTPILIDPRIKNDG